MTEAHVWGLGVIESGVCAFPDCFPDAASTGVPPGTILTPYVGGTITVDDTVLDSVLITTSLIVNANNVVVRNSEIHGDTFMVWVTGGSLTLEDCSITCDDTTGSGIVGTAGTSITATRCDICCCENGMSIDASITIQDSYIHSLFVGPGSHTDGIQFSQPAHDVNIIHNTIESPDGGTSAIIMWDEGDPQNYNMLVQYNRLVGGVFTIYTPRNGPLTNVRVIDNRMGSGVFGYNGGNTLLLTDASGNVDDITGDPITI